MKTAISVPDKLFREAEKHARRTKKSRSRLYSQAVAEYLARHDPDAITESINKVCDRLGPAEYEFAEKAARRIFRAEKW